MIPILDLKQQYHVIRPEIDAAIQRVLDSTHFVLGAGVKELAQRVAAYCDCEYAVGVASGTDALRLSLAALDIGPGDKVTTTPFTSVASANTISHSGTQPVFVDINPQTYNLEPEAPTTVRRSCGIGEVGEAEAQRLDFGSSSQIEASLLATGLRYPGEVAQCRSGSD